MIGFKRIAAVLFILVCMLPAMGCSTDLKSKSTALPLTTIEYGDYSGIRERGVFILFNQADLEEYWIKHNVSKPPVPAPQVDFEKATVLAVHMGERNSGGYRVEVVQIEPLDGLLQVVIKETTPKVGAGGSLTQPYHVVQIPRVASDLKIDPKWN